METIKKIFLLTFRRETHIEIDVTKQLFITHKDSVTSKGGTSSEISPCDQEESETRMMVHIVQLLRMAAERYF